MFYENIQNGLIVEITNNALSDKKSVVTYKEIKNGHSHSLCREWFTQWFMPCAAPYDVLN